MDRVSWCLDKVDERIDKRSTVQWLMPPSECANSYSVVIVNTHKLMNDNTGSCDIVQEEVTKPISQIVEFERNKILLLLCNL